MFDVHQAEISKRALQCADNFALVQQFVILSIQVPLSRVSTDLDTVREQRDDKTIAGILYGWKQAAYFDAWEERETRYWHAMDIYNHGGTERERADLLLYYFAGLPGFGPVKAGFVLQLAFGLSACLDTNNAKRLGLNLRYWHAWDFKNAKPHIKRRKITRYNDTVDKLGGCKTLWNSWCEFVAHRDGKLTPFEVSALHTDALNSHWR